MEKDLLEGNQEISSLRSAVVKDKGRKRQQRRRMGQGLTNGGFIPQWSNSPWDALVGDRAGRDPRFSRNGEGWWARSVRVRQMCMGKVQVMRSSDWNGKGLCSRGIFRNMQLTLHSSATGAIHLITGKHPAWPGAGGSFGDLLQGGDPQRRGWVTQDVLFSRL